MTEKSLQEMVIQSKPVVIIRMVLTCSDIDTAHDIAGSMRNLTLDELLHAIKHDGDILLKHYTVKAY